MKTAEIQKTVDGIVCNWSLRTGTGLTSHSLNELVGTLSGYFIAERNKALDRSVEIFLDMDYDEAVAMVRSLKEEDRGE